MKEYDIYTLDDMGELGVRLGSPMAYDRYGNVLFMETFDSGLGAWIVEENGANAEVVISSTKSYHGRVACFMDSGVNPAPWARVGKFFPPVTDQRIGLQTCFDLMDATHHIFFEIGTYDGVKNRLYGIRYDHSLGTLAYAYPAADWTVFATPGKLNEAEGNFHHIKLIVDTVTKTYVRVLIDKTLYSLSGLTGWVANSDVKPTFYVRVRAWGDGANSTETYIDNLIVTTNER